MKLINRVYSSASIAIIDSKEGKSEDLIDLLAEIKIRGNSIAEVARYESLLRNSENRKLAVKELKQLKEVDARIIALLKTLIHHNTLIGI